MPDYSRRFPGQPYQGDQYVPAAPATGGGSGTGGALTDGDYGDIVVSGTGTVFSIDPAVITSFARSFLDDADATAVKTTLGLQNVNNTADSGKNVLSATKLTTARTINGQPFDGSANITINAVDATARIASSEKGAANGVAPLDASSKIAAAYLPAYVDDVLEYVNLAGFPTTGSAGIIYIADDTGKTYRWSGSAYVEISPSPGSTDSVTEGATNLYYTDARVRAALLTGLASGSGSIAATDSILVAFGKAKAKLDGLAAVASSGSAADLGTGTLPAARMPALTGDVTTTAGAVASTIANNAVSYAKMQDTAAASVLLGRGSAGGAGDPQEITLGSGLAMVGTVLSATGGGGGGGGAAWVRLSADDTAVTVTSQTASSLTFTAAANTAYIVELIGSIQSAGTTTGVNLALDIPSGSVVGQTITGASGSGGKLEMNIQNADNALLYQATNSFSAGAINPVNGRWIVEIGATGGAVTLTISSESAGSAVQLKKPSALGYQAI